MENGQDDSSSSIEFEPRGRGLNRGALKIEVSTSEASITAASEFSIFVVIRNPYDVPINIYSVSHSDKVEL